MNPDDTASRYTQQALFFSIFIILHLTYTYQDFLQNTEKTPTHSPFNSWVDANGTSFDANGTSFDDEVDNIHLVVLDDNYYLVVLKKNNRPAGGWE